MVFYGSKPSGLLKNFVLLLIFGFTTSLFAQKGGTLTGAVIDGETGEPVIGGNVYFENTTLGAATDLDGNFIIFNIPAGSYNLIVSVIGYSDTRIANVRIAEGKTEKLDVTLKSEILTTEVVVVEAEALKDSEGSLLRLRQKAESVSDAISAEEISKTGSGDAAAAMKKVTGASVVGGKYVYIRGLGERYSATTLNGAELPSADPDKKSFQLDLIPSNMLDNINTIKTFTPDKPGTFTGGLVDVTLKSYPEKLTFQLNSSTGYNSAATFNDKFLMSSTGSTDWLGIDDGGRAVPSILKNTDGNIPRIAGISKEDALHVDEISKSFSTTMVPQQSHAPLNSSLGISLGNTIYLNQSKTQSIGYFGSMTWGQNYNFYENGQIGRYKLVGNLNEVEALSADFTGQDTRGSREINWGSIANLAYKSALLGQLKFSYMHTQSAESMGRRLYGNRDKDKDLDPDSPVDTKFETTVISWVERSLNTYQLDGEHVIAPLFNSRIDWKIASSVNDQIEPDQRYFFNVREIIPGEPVFFKLDKSNSQPISRYFRDLSEENSSGQLNFAVPFKQWSGYSSKIKIGAAFTNVDRTYNQRRFDYMDNRLTLNNYSDGQTLNTDSLFQRVGIVDSLTRPTRPDRWFDNSFVIDEAIDSSNFFRGDMKTTAFYGMVDLPLLQSLRFIGGARFEKTAINSRTLDSRDSVGHLKNADVLPSLNLVYSFREKMNFRAAFTQTVARPTFRELAPYISFEFVGDYLFVGNPNLQRTLISNYDLRWEWFVSPGELLALSTFYKNFENPIEYFINPKYSDDSVLRSVKNVPEARVYGFELEARKNLGFISGYLNNFKLGSNLSLVYSEADVPSEDLAEKIDNGDLKPSKTRPFQGQSPYLLNINLDYENLANSLNAGIYYNLYGKRLAMTSRFATPDVYEQEYGQLDAKLSKGLTDNLNFSISVKNILNQDQVFSYRLKNDLVNREFVYSSYKKGITINLGLSYKI